MPVNAPAPREWRDGEHTVSTERSRIDLDVVWAFLTESYWAEGRTREAQAVANDASHCYSCFDATGRQVGFTRVLTDWVSVAYVADVFVVPEARGRGVGEFLMRCALEELAGVRRVLLATRDAHALYAKVGFVPLAEPGRWMERPPA
jgi:GNAT superfamily N-acetyltransferase